MTDESEKGDILVTVRLFRGSGEKVEVTVSAPDDPESVDRTETFTDDQTVMGIYTLMDLMMDVMQGARAAS